MICLPSVLIQQKLQLNPQQPSVISETSEHEQLTSVSELSVITSEPSDNGHHPATAGPTLDISETLEEEQLMSVLATSGLNCQDSGTVSFRHLLYHQRHTV